MVFICSLNLHAAVDSMVEIQGVIGNAFDKNKVQVYDTFDQTFFLPRNVFPKHVKIKPGTPFVLELDEKIYEGLAIKRSDKEIKVNISLEKKSKK